MKIKVITMLAFALTIQITTANAGDTQIISGIGDFFRSVGDKINETLKNNEGDPAQTKEQAIPEKTISTYGLSTNQHREIQSLLTELGYHPGPADGIHGKKTYNAIRQYQSQTNLTVNGKPSSLLLEHLKSSVSTSSATSVGTLDSLPTNEPITKPKPYKTNGMSSYLPAGANGSIIKGYAYPGCAERHSKRALKAYCYANLDSVPFKKIITRGVDFKWFVKINNLPSNTTLETMAPAGIMYAVQPRRK